MRTTPARLAAVLVALLLVAAACGSSKSSTAKTETTSGGSTSTRAAAIQVDEALAAKLPEKIKSAGKIIVATDASYAPNEFYKEDGTTIQGMDVDMANAIGQVLGVQVEVENASFDTIIPSLGTRYDIGMSSFTDSLERQQVVDMVTYFQAGTSFLVQTGKNADLSNLDALCGHSVGVEKGTTQLDDATAQSKTCTDAGNKAVDVQTFEDQTGANQALSTGRVDVVMLDTPVAEYQAKQSNGTFEVAGSSYGVAPYGVAVPKSSEYAGLTDAILGAIQKLNTGGQYTSILTTWGIQDGAITDFKINGATS
ncbi:MAG: ABC transporter substrate-binding protein [Acidimicrobiales bacterium]